MVVFMDASNAKPLCMASYIHIVPKHMSENVSNVIVNYFFGIDHLAEDAPDTFYYFDMRVASMQNNFFVNRIHGQQIKPFSR